MRSVLAILGEMFRGLLTVVVFVAAIVLLIAVIVWTNQ